MKTTETEIAKWSLDCAAQIGRISMIFSSLDLEVSSMIWYLLNTEPLKVSQAVTAEMSFSRKLALLSSLIKIRSVNSTVLSAFENMISQLNKFEAERNLIIHSYWATEWNKEDGLPKIFRGKITAKQKKGLQGFSINPIFNILLFDYFSKIYVFK